MGFCRLRPAPSRQFAIDRRPGALRRTDRLWPAPDGPPGGLRPQTSRPTIVQTSSCHQQHTQDTCRHGSDRPPGGQMQREAWNGQDSMDQQTGWPYELDGPVMGKNPDNRLSGSVTPLSNCWAFALNTIASTNCGRTNLTCMWKIYIPTIASAPLVGLSIFLLAVGYFSYTLGDQANPSRQEYLVAVFYGFIIGIPSAAIWIPCIIFFRRLQNRWERNIPLFLCAASLLSVVIYSYLDRI